jgi:uncharacterized protein (DUF1501 family)
LVIAVKRRDLLKLAAAAPAVFTAGKLWAAPMAGRSRFLLVFLRGGYDAANLLVPVGSDFYYQSRPTIAVPRPGSGLDGALPLDADWGLHPALKDSILPLWEKRQIAFVPFAGSDDLTRSHFETQDTLELGQPIQGHRDFQSGFMNRLAGQLSGAKPIAFTDQLPLTFRGALAGVPNVALNQVGKPSVDARQTGLITAMYQGTPLAASVKSGFQVRDEAYKAISSELQAADRNAISPKGFELEARRVARLMRDEYNLGFVDVGGWDTHVGEGGGQGYLAGRLGELGRGLAGFAEEIGPAWSDTTVVVVSEFGRTFRENGDKGTDHGHGSVYWVLGGSVKGGRIAGEQIRVAQANLNQNRDYPVLTDYRALLGGVFRRTLGVDGGRLEAVFPGTAPADLQLV